MDAVPHPPSWTPMQILSIGVCIQRSNRRIEINSALLERVLCDSLCRLSNLFLHSGGSLSKKKCMRTRSTGLTSDLRAACTNVAWTPGWA